MARIPPIRWLRGTRRRLGSGAGIAAIAAVGAATAIALVAAPAAQAQTAVTARPGFAPVNTFNPPDGSTLPQATDGQPYSTTITANGSPAPTYSATGLPPGLTINATTGAISGTPTTPGTYSPEVTASNEETSGPLTFSSSAEADYTLTVVANRADLSVHVTGPATVSTGSPVTYTVTVSNAGPATATSLDTAVAVSGLQSVTSSPPAPEGSLLGVTGLLFKDPRLASGSTVTYTVSGTVSARRGERIGAIAVTHSAVRDPNPSNNLAAVSEPVT